MTLRVHRLGEARVANLQYKLLAGGQALPDSYSLHNQAYQLWKRNWQKTFEELKSDAKLNAGDFVRQSVINALFSGDQAIGLLFHTFLDLDLDAVRDHGYFSTYPSHIIEQLRAEGSGKVLTMEYLTLDHAWRKSQVGVPLAEILLGLGAKVFEASNFNSMLVVTRNDRRVNEILYGHGAVCLIPNLTKHNVAVDIVSLRKGATHPGPHAGVNYWIDYFWQRRTDEMNLKEFAQAALVPKAA